MNKLNTLSLLTFALGISSMAAANRESGTPTGHLIAGNRSEAELTQLTDQGFRIIDLEVVNTSPYRYTASLVKNTGSYAQGWWWTADRTGAQLETFAADHSARPIDVEVNIVNGQRRYAGVFVSNTGSNAKVWWWFDHKSFAEVQTLATQRNARVIDLEKVGSTYTGVMIRNTGNDARTWGMFQAKSAVQIRSIVTSERLVVDMEPVGNDLYDGVWQSSNGVLSWRRFNMTWDQMVEDVKQQGSRVTDVERTSVGGQSRYSYLLINNSTPLETRIGEYMRNRTNGRVGFYLSRVGTGKIAGLMEQEPFYPASSIKVLQHAYISYRVGRQGLNVNTQIPHYTDTVNDTHPANNSTVAFNLSLAATCSAMMVNSNNQSTNSIQDFAGQDLNGTPNGVIGRNRIDSFKTNQIGLGASTRIWHKFGNLGPASNPANVSTAVNLTSIYTSALSTDLLGANGRLFFLNNMLTESSNSGLNLALRQVITDEAAKLGMLAADRNAFRDAMQVAWKNGNWGTAWVSSGGWVRIPFRSESGRVGSRTYVLSGWIDNASTNGISSISIEVMGELMRDEIRTALQSW
ncbi:MAG TPA: serine hydrolase [Fimbriimonas sp.]|nr:serine hydrolase [Fimbriimonas sp.]